MKKFLEKNKGVVLFYIVVLLLAMCCAYRFKKLNEIKEPVKAVVINDFETDQY